jgi:exo-beta-1,3-glucanase (GH17 family)
LACGLTIDTAISDPNWGFDVKYQGLRKQIISYGLTDMTINIGETGWPSAGKIPTPSGCTNGVASASSTSQEKYLQEIGNWVASQNSKTQVFMFEAFDELWKGNCDRSRIDSNWGLLPLPQGLNVTPPFGACQTPHNP